MTRLPSAAAALYPNLPTGTPDVVPQRQQGSVADAMYAHLRPPRPNPLVDRWHDAAAKARAAWGKANARAWGGR
jgi:hypothetical protein